MQVCSACLVPEDDSHAISRRSRYAGGWHAGAAAHDGQAALVGSAQEAPPRTLALTLHDSAFAVWDGV